MEVEWISKREGRLVEAEAPKVESPYRGTEPNSMTERREPHIAV